MKKNKENPFPRVEDKIRTISRELKVEDKIRTNSREPKGGREKDIVEEISVSSKSEDN